MVLKIRKRACSCSQSIPLSSTFLFLSLILPKSSFAQFTATSVSSIDLASQTTFQISTSPTSSSQATSNPPPSATQSFQATPTPIPDDGENGVRDHVFNYYFLLLAVAAVLVGLCILYITKRKKRKQQIQRSTSQRALARDVEYFRNRFAIMRRGANSSSDFRPSVNREEGLDERGDPPPPYVPGTKPPSINDEHIQPMSTAVTREADGAEDVELGNVTRIPVHNPPTYDEDTNIRASRANMIGADTGVRRPVTADAVPAQSESADHAREEVDVRRPESAVLGLERVNSRRRLLSLTGSIAH